MFSQPFLIADVHIEVHGKPYCLSPKDYATLPAGREKVVLHFDPLRALQAALPSSRQTLLTICDPWSPWDFCCSWTRCLGGHLTWHRKTPCHHSRICHLVFRSGVLAKRAERPAEGAVPLWRVVLEEAQELSPQDGPPQDIWEQEVKKQAVEGIKTGYQTCLSLSSNHDRLVLSMLVCCCAVLTSVFLTFGQWLHTLEGAYMWNLL